MRMTGRGKSARAPKLPATRVRIGDPPRTREKILRVATQEFATLGYDGARIDGIVARCGISKNLLYHYYASKEDLFVRVMERAYAAMRARSTRDNAASSASVRSADMTPSRCMGTCDSPASRRNRRRALSTNTRRITVDTRRRKSGVGSPGRSAPCNRTNASCTNDVGASVWSRPSRTR